MTQLRFRPSRYRPYQYFGHWYFSTIEILPIDISARLRLRPYRDSGHRDFDHWDFVPIDVLASIFCPSRFWPSRFRPCLIKMLIKFWTIKKYMIHMDMIHINKTDMDFWYDLIQCEIVSISIWYEWNCFLIKIGLMCDLHELDSCQNEAFWPTSIWFKLTRVTSTLMWYQSDCSF